MQLLKINARIPSPRLPTSTTDPVGADRRVGSAWKQLDSKYKELQKRILDLFEAIPTAQVNVDGYGYQYDFSAQRAASISDEIQRILDEVLLDGADYNRLWIGIDVTGAYESATRLAQSNLASMSADYAAQRTISDILFSEPYLRRLGIAYSSTYSDWRGLSDQGRSQLASVITEGIATGKNPSGVTEDIVKRLDVSKSYAKQLAQTEITGVLRQARRDEAGEANTLLGLNVALLWSSALIPTTRLTHGSLHGKTKTPEWVADFYSKDGNRYNCRCAQTEVLIVDGQPQMTQRAIERYAEAKEAWMSEKK
ncbi:hypothetical protein GH714_044089 [Hevea brasiliensis]|uniref:Phage head morphogenesis domain-containing protein n=1 Tax=Hevea brasiliensis TaxID=3981 RepID=A0A6A6K2E9_HEVBR|nr:hypothetical protein GH714_044089 [Hevea brasiliensis]